MNYTAAAGDCCIGLADCWGLTGWQAIYNAPQNSSLKTLRSQPNQLVPGDTVFVPPPAAKNVSASTMASHSFTLKQPRVMLQLRIQDENSTNFSDVNYQLQAPGLAAPYSGTIDCSGVIVAPKSGEPRLPIGLANATLLVWLDAKPGRVPCRWSLRIGQLQPIETAAGVRARLQNMGFLTSASGAPTDYALASAIRAFQTEQELPPSGQMDSQTLAQLASRHDHRTPPPNLSASVAPRPYFVNRPAAVARVSSDLGTKTLSATLSVRRSFRFSI